jgi:hypothetical protein
MVSLRQCAGKEPDIFIDHGESSSEAVATRHRLLQADWAWFVRERQAWERLQTQPPSSGPLPRELRSRIWRRPKNDENEKSPWSWDNHATVNTNFEVNRRERTLAPLLLLGWVLVGDVSAPALNPQQKASSVAFFGSSYPQTKDLRPTPDTQLLT